MKPDWDRMFFNTPCSHPSFFVSAALSRALGGYDSQGFICSADTDFMYRIIRSTGYPLKRELHVANFLGGGVSSNCMDDFRDENVEHLWRNWDMVEAKMKRDPDFLRAMEACLAAHCKEFDGWQERHGRAVPKQLGELQELCRKAAGHAHSAYARFALRTLAAAYLPTLAKGRKTTAWKRRLRDFCIHACYMDEGNRYREYLWHPKTPFWTHPVFSPLKKLLGR